MIDLKVLFDRLPGEIERLHACGTEPRLAEDRSKLVITIDALDFEGTVSAWLNGCCDIDLIRRGARARDGKAWHGEFSDTEAAIQALVAVIELLPELPE
ncbi:MAG TPA: hypothetical protein VK714_20495 [Myxococcota bacterium]|nr:hypothetical protein [Myxococcota bacterium]